MMQSEARLNNTRKLPVDQVAGVPPTICTCIVAFQINTGELVDGITSDLSAQPQRLT